MDKRSILVVDDQRISAEALVSLLSKQEAVCQVDFVTSGSDALIKLNELHYDLVLLDVEMPQMDGIQVAERIREKHPALKVIALTVNDSGELIQLLYDEGLVDGYLTRTYSFETLMEAIDDVMHGNSFLPDELALKLQDHSGYEQLTKRQKEIIRLTIEGLTEKEMAERTFVTRETIRNHKAMIFDKLNVRKNTLMIKEFLKRKFLSTDDPDKIPPFKRID